MTLKTEWLRHGWSLAAEPADFYSGARKIIRSRSITFYSLDSSLVLRDAGYTKSKQTLLTKHYLHEESRQVAIDLWNKRRGQAKYGSVGFTCYAHFVKGGSIDAKRSKRASVFGPCIQAVNLTLIDKKSMAIDVFYRTTEWFKKFPADLVFLRDVLLPPFDMEGIDIAEVNFHFANITLHPMYAITALACANDPVKTLEKLKKKDPYFFDWTVKWSARYVCDEYHRGIAKFAQAMRVHKDARERIPADVMPDLQQYLRDNHPGYRNGYTAPEEIEDEDADAD